MQQTLTADDESEQPTSIPDASTASTTTEVLDQQTEQCLTGTADESAATTTDAPATSMDHPSNHDVDWAVENLSSIGNFSIPSLEPTTLNTTSPASTASGNFYSAEVAPLRWLDLLTRDSTTFDNDQSGSWYLGLEHHHHSTGQGSTTALTELISGEPPETHSGQLGFFDIEGPLELSASESILLRYFVDHISTWIDLTDRDALFANYVPIMALKNRGLMLAILALSSRHQSLLITSEHLVRVDRTVAVQYYNETLRYLQIAMEIPEYLKSEELLATVLLISTYEMIDGFESGWDRHLKGIQFWQFAIHQLQIG